MVREPRTAESPNVVRSGWRRRARRSCGNDTRLVPPIRGEPGRRLRQVGMLFGQPHLDGRPEALCLVDQFEDIRSGGDADPVVVDGVAL